MVGGCCPVAQPLPAMSDSRHRHRQNLVWSAILAAPTWVLLGVLVLAGALDWPWLVTGLVIWAAVYGLIRQQLRALAALSRHARMLADQRQVEGAPLVPESLEPLAGSLNRLARNWAREREALAERSHDWSTIVACLPQPLLTLDLEGRITHANREARDLLGDGLVGREATALLRAPQLLAALESVSRDGGQRQVDFDMPVPVERAFNAHVARLDRPIGDGTVLLVALNDVSDRRRSEQMRVDFVANVSHELRTPLATLIGFIETLRGPARDDADARRRFLGMMADQAGRMARLVDDLLSLSRIELNELSPPLGRVALGDLLATVADEQELRAHGRNITLDLSVPGDLPDIVGDGDELTQVFQNLVDNAIKYARPDSVVRITARRRDGMVAVAVADEGEGIAREHLPRLTERFYRVDRARSRKLGGTGLGLAIVKHILNRHRGRLEVASVLGQGSTFTVLLPAASRGDARESA